MNNSTLQVLRGTSANIEKNKSSMTLLDGQILYNKSLNYLTVGGGHW